MKTTVTHIKNAPKDAIYIGRPSQWGNPFSHLSGTKAIYVVKTREEAVTKYREWILTQPRLLADLPKLKGKILACWCHPKACHGDVLAELADKT